MKTMMAHPTRDIAAAKADIDALGYCLIEGALSSSDIADYKTRVQSAAGRSGGVMNLIGRDARFLDLAQHPAALALADHQLGPEFLLSGSNAIIQRPGAPAQRLHNDQAFAPPPWPYPL